jgi:hypothetical protein
MRDCSSAEYRCALGVRYVADRCEAIILVDQCNQQYAQADAHVCMHSQGIVQKWNSLSMLEKRIIGVLCLTQQSARA